jgi:hypothetical protein
VPALDSKSLSFVRYDEKKRELFANFRGHKPRCYIYEDVSPEEYAALMQADSKGAWFNAHIRDKHRFREV